MDRHGETRSGRSRVAVHLIFGGPHRLESLGESQRVTVVAARGNPVAAGRRVPCRFGPFNSGPVRHRSLLPPTYPIISNMRTPCEGGAPGGEICGFLGYLAMARCYLEPIQTGSRGPDRMADVI